MPKAIFHSIALPFYCDLANVFSAQLRRVRHSDLDGDGRDTEALRLVEWVRQVAPGPCKHGDHQPPSVARRRLKDPTAHEVRLIDIVGLLWVDGHFVIPVPAPLE